MNLSALEIARACSGEIIAGSVDASATSFSIDSRTVVAGTCFVALESERDGHDYVGDASANGATIALVRKPVDITGAMALVQVVDPLSALGALAKLARTRLSDVTVVGVTGSAGKTATKDLAAAALAPARRVHASPSSFNNEAGLPLTLLGAPDDVEVIVAEMGARFAGNIRDLAQIARPQIGIVTHVGWAHAEHLGGRSGIAAVKGELLELLPADGLAVLNAECDATPGLASRTQARVLTVGRTQAADVVVSDIVLDDELRPSFALSTPWGDLRASLELRGEHQVENAGMAAAVALDVGTPIDDVARGLAAARGAAQRMELIRTDDGVTVVDDSYNSSPTSAIAAVRSLVRLPVDGQRIAVLGEMLELGSHSEAGYTEVGRAVGEGGVDVLIAVGRDLGPLAEVVRRTRTVVHEVADADEAIMLVLRAARPGDAVLVKASRAVGLERVAEALVERESVT